ncbi:acetate/propionate family kinase [uncultured Secundilactobacillus sp.]|uniref:acetate/propionate family kinase n=1 Tax=uncultured Secundilactobacillus sp. TaxID=2813935 RepID=UPI00258C7AED|nr:acetate kinase [uncultured Secundilactobacillus sp.]
MSNKVLAINSGSSSLKFKLFEMPAETVLSNGQIQRIGFDDAIVEFVQNGKASKTIEPIADHGQAIKKLLEMLLNSGIIQSKDDIKGVGHRISHGGSAYDQSVVVDDQVKQKIDELSVLSPLHNPVNLKGIVEFEKALPHAVQVAVFDTSFHKTMPEEAYMYALPYDYYEKEGIRRFGFHGPSHEYVSEKAKELFGEEVSHKVITCHLGNGSSLCAIKDGKSIDTSMGFTPLAGLVMGSRTGDIDPEIIPFIEETRGLDSEGVRQLLNKQSGLLGISGVSNDLREVQEAAESGNHRAQLAVKMFVHQIQHYIGAYAADLDGLDTLIFTAGIGEHSSSVRQLVCEKLGYLGVSIDDTKNQNNEVSIESQDSRVKVAVIPTDEEIVIARDVVKTAGL